MATTETTRSGGASSSSQKMGDELARDAGRLKDAAKDRAMREAETRKGEASVAAKSASSALDKAASELKQDEDAPEWLASAFEKTASRLERFAGGIENRSPEQIGREVSSFARQNPAAFLAASAAAGFAAARFLRAGAEYRHHQQDGSHAMAGSGGNQSAFTGMSQSRPGMAEGGTVL